MPHVFYSLDIDNLIRRYQAGESELKLAREFSVSRNVVRRRLVDAGMTPRTGSQANFLRFARMTKDEIAVLTAPSHNAIRGSHRTERTKVKSAIYRERHPWLGASKSEYVLAQMLLDKRGVNTIPQKAIGIYNVDLAIELPRVAVEVYGGNWHTCPKHTRLHNERTPYILNEGWNIVIVWVSTRSYPLSLRAADYIVAFMQELSLNKPTVSQYRMIRGDGKPMTFPGCQLNGIPAIESATSGDQPEG